MTNNAGAILSQLSYDVYGRVKKVQGAQSPVFQFGDYYTHEESGLNLTFSRAYSSNHARFISRDSIEEDGGLNLYAYMDNHLSTTSVKMRANVSILPLMMSVRSSMNIVSHGTVLHI